MINKTLAILAGGKSSRMNYNNKLQLLIKSFNLKVIEGDDKRKFIERDFSNINTEKEYRELEEV